MFKLFEKLFDRGSRKADPCEAISLVESSLAEAGLVDRVGFVKECIENNEAGVAFETLCDNLHEFECPITMRAFELLRKVGESMNMDSDCWDRLQSQIVAEPRNK